MRDDLMPNSCAAIASVFSLFHFQFFFLMRSRVAAAAVVLAPQSRSLESQENAQTD
jgi:hypothetical protein